MKSHTDSTHVKTRKEERSEATRAALVRIARALFTERGFAGTSTEEVVQRAGVTRGALYHQFRDKQDLFLAVFEQLERELAERIAHAAQAALGGVWEKFLAGCSAFLEACVERDVRQIVMIDAPSVLGRETWHRIDGVYALGMVRAGLASLVEAGLVEQQPLEPLAALLVGALNEAGMIISYADDVQGVRAEMSASLGRLLAGLRQPNGVPQGRAGRGSSRR